MEKLVGLDSAQMPGVALKKLHITLFTILTNNSLAQAAVKSIFGLPLRALECPDIKWQLKLDFLKTHHTTVISIQNCRGNIRRSKYIHKKDIAAIPY